MSTQILVTALLATLVSGFNLGMAATVLIRRTEQRKARSRALVRRLADYRS